uniref:LisH domain-containing protein n=1 Tax=Trichobilharzia regenti TaxID=157069 RepID=A0AA85IV69_TRIRE|nr:unnamed protein product [Trichobilharzia regenti]
MTSYFNLLPSEISGLVIGFLRDSECIGAAEAFFQECPHLSEFRAHYSSVNEIPTFFRELTLLDILRDYVNIVNGVVPHLKKINLPCHLGKLADSVTKILRNFVRQKVSYQSGHPEWMPVGRVYVQPRIESTSSTLSDIQPQTTASPTTNSATTPSLLDKITSSNCIGHQAQSVSESSQDEQTTVKKTLSITNPPSSSFSVSSIASVQIPTSSTGQATVNYTGISPSKTNEIMRENYSSQICLLQSGDEVNNLSKLSDDNNNDSIFYVYPHLPRSLSDGDNKNVNNKCVSTKRKRSQPPRHLSSSPSAGSTTKSGLVTNCEEDEELDMEHFLSALFTNAEQVATRINTEVVVPNRNSDGDDSDTTKSAVTAASNNNVAWKCVKEDPSIYEGNNDKSIETRDTILKSEYHSSNNDLCTTQSSDNLQMWNEWFGVKGDLDTCIDRLLSDFESNELTNTSTSTSTTNIPATKSAADITTNITTFTSTAATTTTNTNTTNTVVVNFENYNDVYIVDIDDPLHESAIKMLKVSMSVISNPCVSQSLSIPVTSSSSSSSPSSVISVSPVTVSTTTIPALPITLTTRTSCESHVNSPVTSSSTRLLKRNKNIHKNDRFITLENSNNNASMTSKFITNSQQITHQPVTITSSGLCSDQLSEPLKQLRNKRRCLNKTSNDHNNNNNNNRSGSSNSFTTLSSVLNTLDSNKAYNRNEYEIYNSNNNTTTNNNEGLFSYNPSPSCLLFNKNTVATTSTVPTDMPSLQQYRYRHLLNDLPACYYFFPMNAQAPITRHSTSTSMATVPLTNNHYPVIDLTRLSDSNNSSNNTTTITNIPTSTTITTPATVATIATENTTSTGVASTFTTISTRLIPAIPSSIVAGDDVRYVNTSQNNCKQYSKTSEISTDAKENQPPQGTSGERKKYKYIKFTIIGR